MKTGVIQGSLPTAISKIDLVVEGLMVVLLAFTPLAFGTTEAWSQEIFVAIVAALVLCLGLKIATDRSFVVTHSWAYLPIALFLVFAFLQLLPLPSSVIRSISPGTFQTKSSLLADLPNAPEILRRMTVTFYSAASREQIRLVAAVAALFVVVVNFYRTPARIARLLLTIACVGLAVAFLAIYQNLTGAETVYGMVPAIQKNCGPFMCYSHFGQFMNLSVGAAFGLLLVRLSEMYQRYRHGAGVIAELREPSSWPTWLLIATCVLGPITVFLSMTRMGMISLLIAAGITAAMLAWRNRAGGKASLLLCIGIVVLAGLLSAGFDVVYSRLATMRHVEVVDGGRLQMLRDMTSEFKLFPLVGTGLGTHEFVFPMFDHSHIAQIATHAENEYAQLLEECGFIGIALAGFFLCGVLFNYVKVIWRPRETIQYAAFGLGLGLLAILIHSASDFGQHVPANAALTAIFAGLLANLAGVPWKKSKSKNESAAPVAHGQFTLGRSVAFAGVLAGLALFSWAIWSGDYNRRAEVQWNRAYDMQAVLEKNAWQGTNEEFVDLLTPAAAAADLEPTNVTYRYWLNVFRWRAISRVTDAKTHTVLLTSNSISFAARITAQLHEIRTLCPTFGPPLCVAGQLEQFVLHRPIGAEHILTAFHLTPYDRTVCFVAGKLAVDQKEWDESLEAFRRCAALGGFNQEIIDTYINAQRPDLAMEIAKGNRSELSYLADRLADDANFQQIAMQCRNEATSLLLTEANDANASADVMADLAAQYAQQGEISKAIDWYQKALNLDYGQVDWRLRMAGMLADTGHVSDALEEAKVCIRLRPQSSEAQKMIGDLSLRKDAGDRLGVSGAAGANLATEAGLITAPTR